MLERGAGAPAKMPLEAEPGGYFSGLVAGAGAGSCYRFQVDDDEKIYPDPVSRYQPDGPHGCSQVVDAAAYRWRDKAWRGASLEGQIMYEMHVGTFTPEGTWQAARAQLKELAALGITCIEMMPVCDFAGTFGWGYDGVSMFAPTRLYGEPDDLRDFIDEAHANGIAVILDVVYNHLGPDGNYLKTFAADYFSNKYENEWGEAINFDGPNSGPVREFFVTNAAYWIEEYHFDGLRLDATQQIFDESEEYIVKTVSRRVREAAQGRQTIIVAENEPQHTILVREYGVDGLWNDDFHHSATAALTNRNEAYYTDYLGKAQEFISAAKYGYLYQGQRYKWQKNRRGTPALDLTPSAFVTFIQNHDQVANSGRGERLNQVSSPAAMRAMSALLLLMPGTPMLFQGQEFASSAPFLYFADHNPKLNRMVRRGRRKFLAQFPSLAQPEVEKYLADPGDGQTFARCKLDFSERQKHREVYDLHRDLIRLRREDPVFRAPRKSSYDGAVLAERAFVLRYFGGAEGDRLLVVNFGFELRLDPAPEPLLAPMQGTEWSVLWSSEDPLYGGYGTYKLDSEENWRLPGCAAVALKPARIVEKKER